MDRFIHFGLSHLAAMALIVAVSFLMVRFMLSDATERLKKTVRITLACFLILAVLMDPALNFLRHGIGDYGWQQFWNSALPFYLCDVVSIVAAIALFTKNRYLTELTYLWGLAGTTQGLITPTLYFDWNTFEYYNFFLQHGGVPIAAVTLVWGMRIYPAKGAFKRIVIWSWIYMAIVMGLNCLLCQNYGFLNGKPGCSTMFDYMGPYPYYLLTLQAIAFTLYWMLLKITPQEKEPA